MSGAMEAREEIREAEDAVCGTLLHHEAGDIAPELIDALEPGDFYSPRHGELWDLLCTRWAAKLPCDPINVAAELTSRGDLTRLGGVVWLHQLYDAVPTVATALHYAELVREDAQWRSLAVAGTRMVAAAHRREGSVAEAAETAVEAARTVRDRQGAAEVPARDLLDFLAEEDDVPEWVIPGVLARWDRLMITAGEGGGKSLLLRQILMRAAAGLHPWKRARIAPVRVLLVDAENADSQIRPWLRRMAGAAAEEGAPVARGTFHLEVRPEGLDLTTAADRAWLARTVERTRPDLISIGPLYKLTTSGASDEEAARPLMSALEMIRTVSGGAAMVLEAHSPHASMGKRDLRPIGSSLWMRWPEFGFGLAESKEAGADALRLRDWIAWRGPRSERDWPEQFCEGATWPWQAIQHAGNAPVPSITLASLTKEQGERALAAGLVPEQPEFWDDQQIGQ
ncbi:MULTISPECIES: AAA family ATPase [unclassified Streptomyces]|uniref:AAA family ATPase n=1 Tax=unclassified Streptomyces TaxID=2593676 RepID=UPI0035DFD6D8